MNKQYNHPDTCWVWLVGNDIGVVKWGESGYYRTDYPSGKYTEELVAELNDKSGYTRTEIEAMQMCSMAYIPQTEEAWNKHFQTCCDIIDRHNEVNDNG